MQEEDRFCGTCGARVAPVTHDDPQMILESVAASHGDGYRGGRGAHPTTTVALVSLVLLAVAGVAVYLALGGLGLPDRTAPTAVSDSVSAESPPDSAFELLLPTLEERTTAPVWLPARLPNGLKNVAVDGGATGDGTVPVEGWGLAFLLTPPDEVIGEWPRAQVVGTLRAAPEPVENEYFEATSEEAVELPDGTQATLRRMVPVEEGGTQGPYWEGTFEKDGYHFALTVTSEALSGEDARQALSSMVEVRGGQGRAVPEETVISVPPLEATSTTPDTTTESATGSEATEAEVEEAAGDYYEAVDREDWAFTYGNLDSETRALFSEEEWRLKNQWFADNEGLELASIEVEAAIDLGGAGAEVRVDRTFEDGTSVAREAYFVREGGEWVHHFTDEEQDIFMPGVPYEEFIERQ
ncbi:MAG TPA: hypothetical protein VKA73_16340 [Rubrobacter sp.]|nr:hypothetical protein [Rubrobacter sp.]